MNPAIADSSVVLPDPLGPSRATTSPGATVEVDPGQHRGTTQGDMEAAHRECRGHAAALRRASTTAAATPGTVSSTASAAVTVTSPSCCTSRVTTARVSVPGP